MRLRTTCSISNKSEVGDVDDSSSVHSGRERLSSAMVSLEQFSVFWGTLLFLMTHLLC